MILTGSNNREIDPRGELKVHQALKASMILRIILLLAIIILSPPIISKILSLMDRKVLKMFTSSEEIPIGILAQSKPISPGLIVCFQTLQLLLAI